MKALMLTVSKGSGNETCARNVLNVCCILLSLTSS